MLIILYFLIILAVNLVDVSSAVPHYYTRAPSSTITVHTNIRHTRPSIPYTLVEKRFGAPTALKGHAISTQNVFPTQNIHGYPRIISKDISLEDRVIRKLLRTHSPFLHREESLWPQGVFIPPADPKRMGYGPNEIETDYSGFQYQEYDPFLLTGYEALSAVQRLTARGELFFGDIPHDRQLRWLNFVRKCNRLAGHIRASERPGFPYYRI